MGHMEADHADLIVVVSSSKSCTKEVSRLGRHLTSRHTVHHCVDTGTPLNFIVSNLPLREHIYAQRVIHQTLHNPSIRDARDD